MATKYPVTPEQPSRARKQQSKSSARKKLPLDHFPEADYSSKSFEEPVTTAAPTKAPGTPKRQAADGTSEKRVQEDASTPAKALSAKKLPLKDKGATLKFGSAGSKEKTTLPEVQAMYKVKTRPCLLKKISVNKTSFEKMI
jgi:hypothetical protein